MYISQCWLSDIMKTSSGVPFMIQNHNVPNAGNKSKNVNK